MVSMLERVAHINRQPRAIAIFIFLVLCGVMRAQAGAFVAEVRADLRDPLDPFAQDSSSISTTDEHADDNKTIEELLWEANILLDDQRLLDGRSKLLKALQRDPKEYRTYMMLAGYYMQHVGHFRLALKYTKQALTLFEAKNGKPPFTDTRLRAEHAQLLYLLSQARLNLDNYQGSLDVLDEYTSYGYYSIWYPGTRAWVLMKLGRVEEAIRVARLGALAGAEPGRTLNMLGILLSMHGERESSLNVFQDAVAIEMSLGPQGQPATPLNNSGEVYKEIFQEDRAEAAWRKATSLPDGCEHVLASLNLSLLYIDQLRFKRVNEVMNQFESCVAQFPLRNGEEHRALESLARGRADLHTGRTAAAIQRLEKAIEDRQWFGKIGTSAEDLKAGAMISLAQALRAHNQRLINLHKSGFFARLAALPQRAANEIRAAWLMRRTRQLLIEELSNFEDLYVRNTDSMLEYPTLGEVLREIPARILERKLKLETAADDRSPAKLFYRLYLGENYLANGRSTEGRRLVTEVLDSAREKYDNLIKVHALELLLAELNPADGLYQRYAEQLFMLNRAKFANRGLKLPVNFDSALTAHRDQFEDTPFMLDNTNRLPFALELRKAPKTSAGKTEEQWILRLSQLNASIGTFEGRGTDLDEAISSVVESVFTEDPTA